MSVLIRGMDEIPEDGAVLVVKHDDNGKVYIKYAGMMGYSMELERIPESHGDLIDRNEFLVKMNLAIALMKTGMVVLDAKDDKELQMELNTYLDIRDGLKECDVVIEAEGAGE